MSLDNAPILITGGCGQIGIALVTHLRTHHPSATISVLDLAQNPPPTSTDNVTYFSGNVTNAAVVQEVLRNVRPQVVFHAAGLIPQIAKRMRIDAEAHYVAVNVQGTKNVLEAARDVGSVKAFVFTSSSDVVKGGSWQDLRGVDESVPVPGVFDDAYAKSKALAESAVLSSTAPDFPTTAIRTHAVFSANDTNLLPLLLSAPRNIHLGPGKNLYDFTYAPNLAAAHVLAAQNLLSVFPAETSNPLSAAGKPFFVTNAEPIAFRVFLNMVWKEFDDASDARRASDGKNASGSRGEEKKVQGKGNFTIPIKVAVGMAWVGEKIARVTGKEAALTMKNLGDGMAERWFDNAAAKRVLGYEPRIKLVEGVREAAAGWKGSF